MYKKQHLRTSLFLHPCEGITSHAWGWRALVSTLSTTLSGHSRDVNALQRCASSCRIIRNRLSTYRSHLRSCRTYSLSARVSTWRALVVAINQALNSQHPYTPRRERSRPRAGAELTFAFPVPSHCRAGAKSGRRPATPNKSFAIALAFGRGSSRQRKRRAYNFQQACPKEQCGYRVSLWYRATIYIADMSRARELRRRPR
jgi:hypothetical protein